jgi:hypothetical protein
MPERVAFLKGFRMRCEVSGKLMIPRCKVRERSQVGDSLIGAGQASASAFGLIKSSIPRNAFGDHHMLRRVCEQMHTLQNPHVQRNLPD